MQGMKRHNYPRGIIFILCTVHSSELELYLKLVMQNYSSIIYSIVMMDWVRSSYK